MGLLKISWPATRAQQHGLTEGLYCNPVPVDFSNADDDARAMTNGPAPLPSPATGKWNALLNRFIDSPSAMIIANTGTQAVLRMGSSIVLAHLLVPSAFAQIAITMLIMTGMTMVSDVGIAIAALREGVMSREDEHKLWTMQVLRGFVVGFTLIAVAAPVGWLYGDRELGWVIATLALMPILQGAQSLYPVLALAHRRLLPSTLLEIGSRTVGTAVSIVVALLTPTVWSLVAGTLAGVALSSFVSHCLGGYRPRFVVDRGYIASQWRFSRWIQLSSTIGFVGSQIDKPLLPFFFNMTTLGIYGIGAALAGMPAQLNNRWSASVFWPLTTQLLRRDASARIKLLHVRITMLLYSSIMALTVVAVSPVFFMIFYNTQYFMAAKFAQILGIGTFFEIAESSLRHMPLVDGVSRYEVWSTSVRITSFSIAAALVVFFKGDAFSYALAVVFSGAVAHVFMLYVCNQRGYLSIGPDVALTVALTITSVVLYFFLVPPVTMIMQLAEAGSVLAVAGAALFIVYKRRGLPSLPAEPAPIATYGEARKRLVSHPK